MKRHAFTLVELLVVIAIIGLLSTVAVLSSSSSRDKAKIASGQSFEQSVYQKLGDRLEGEWKFESVNGGTTPDTSGNGRTGTVVNATLTAGISGNALSFPGNAYVDVGAISITSDVTVGAWIRPAVANMAGFIVGKNPVNSQWEIFLEGPLKWRGGDAVTTPQCTAPPINTWHYVVGTQSGNQARLYIDGVQCAAATVTAIGNGAGTVQIGIFGSGAYPFNGLIDEVRVYSGSLLEP